MATSTNASTSAANVTTISSVKVTTTTTTTATAASGPFESGTGAAILALLIIILLLLILVPLVLIIVIRKFNILKTHPSQRHIHDNTKEAQTDVIGLELEEFYQRRKPIDMSKYFGKKLPEVTEEYPRFNILHPDEWNDPWTRKYSGKETERVARVW